MHFSRKNRFLPEHDYIATIDYTDYYARTQKQSISGEAHFCKDYIETIDYTDYYARTQKQSISGEAHFCKDYIETIDYTDYYARTQKQSVSGEAQKPRTQKQSIQGRSSEAHQQSISGRAIIRSKAICINIWVFTYMYIHGISLFMCTHACQLVSTPVQVHPLSTVSMPAKW